MKPLRAALTLVLLGSLALAGCNTGTHKSTSSSSSTTAPSTSGTTAPTTSGTTTPPTTPPTPPVPAMTAAAGSNAVAAAQFAGGTLTGLTFELSSGTGPVKVIQLTVANKGTIDESLLGAASLIDDANGNGIADAGEAVLATGAKANVDDDPYLFVPTTPIAIGANATRAFVVTIDASALATPPAAVAKTIELEVTDAASVVAEDDQGQPVTPAGNFPLGANSALFLNVHALISEIGTGPGSAATSQEFVELFNPTLAPIDLSTYYLTDFTDTVTAGKFYWKLPTGADFGPAGNATSADFMVKFPQGTTLAPGALLVVAIDSEGFKAAYGKDADFCLRNKGATTSTQMLSWDGRAGSVTFSATAVSTSVGLTGPGGGTFGNGEMLTLFTWDGTADLVKDIDIVNFGGGSATNTCIDKSPNQTAPGSPDVRCDSAFDADNVASTYQKDQDEFFQFNHRSQMGASIKRVDFTEGAEIKTGGNGIAGHDETSEDFGDGAGGNVGTFVGVALATDATPGAFN